MGSGASKKLKAEHATVTAEIESIKEQHAAVVKQITDKKEESAALDKAQEELRTEIKTANDAVAAKEAEQADLAARLATEQDVNTSLRADVTAAEEVNTELTGLHAEHTAVLEAADAERAANVAELLATQAAAVGKEAEARSELEAQLAELEAAFATKTAELEALVAQEQEARELRATTGQSTTAELGELQEMVDQAEQECAHKIQGKEQKEERLNYYKDIVNKADDPVIKKHGGSFGHSTHLMHKRRASLQKIGGDTRPASVAKKHGVRPSATELVELGIPAEIDMLIDSVTQSRTKSAKSS